MRTLPTLAFLVLLSLPARAATITGSDYAGADLLPANGDTLSGTFTNVGLFRITAGSTVTVASLPSGPNLVVYATTVSIAGTLEGSGQGQLGGSGGASPSAGANGYGGSPAGTPTTAAGAGAGGASGKGGGGGGGGGTGGCGADSGGTACAGGTAAGGGAYGSTGTLTSPISTDDLFQGAGGGGGGGANGQTGGTGGSGGGAIYLEASSMTILGSILLSGSDAASASDANVGTHPGGGGGGGGGTLLLRVPGTLDLVAGAQLSANGGRGGDVLSLLGGAIVPGGGGAGGRVKIFFRPGNSFSVSVSTSGGAAGGKGGFSGTVDASTQPGAAGTASFGRIASAPAAFAAPAVYVTSISWTWSAPGDFGDAPGAQSYRIYPATATVPYSAAEATALTAGATVTGLAPNTTYFRFVTAFTAWGDSLPSNAVSTHTKAIAPAGPSFSSVAETALSFLWTAGTPSNPDYTSYVVERATDSSFGAASVQTLVALSSAPTGLTPNTTYYWRVKAVNLDAVPTTYTAALATVTLAAAPSAPAFGGIGITSACLTWSGGNNPADTFYTAQVSSDNFFSLIASSSTLGSSATFFSLTPGTQYYFRAFALNLAGLPSAFTAVLSTRPGNLSDTSSPAAPSRPGADRRFSYDGTVVYSWPAAQSPVGILDYHLIVGSTPGGSDVFSGSTTTLSYAISGLAAGRTYYARVRAQSNAGAFSAFSDISDGVPVFITAQAAPVAKPYNWPNPFDPAQGPTQIGFYLEEAAAVEIKIYTLQGEAVYEESFSYSSAGNQVASWNGANNSGMRVAPGGYVVLLRKRYGGRVEVQKLKVAVLY